MIRMRDPILMSGERRRAMRRGTQRIRLAWDAARVAAAMSPEQTLDAMIAGLGRFYEHAVEATIGGMRMFEEDLAAGRHLTISEKLDRVLRETRGAQEPREPRVLPS